MKNIIVSFLMTMTCYHLSAITIFVDLNATGTNNGTSWTNAFTDLQDAIAVSSFGDEIWVAQGTYKPTSGTSRSIYFNIKNGTEVYGGFNGTETVISERDVALNVTILSAEIGTGSSTDNSYHVARFSNVGNQTRLDGFTIVGAYNNADEGGGVETVNSSPVIAKCIFQGNYALEGGGALNHSGSGNLNLENCIFNGNVGNTYGGGALRIYAGPVNITNCYFKSNQSNTYGGAIFIYGATVNISNSVFAGNSCETSGSAIRVSDVGELHLANSLIVGNFTNGSSAIEASTFSNSSPHTIKNCTIAHNKQANSAAQSNPCAVAMNNDATITNSIIYGNSNSIQVLGTGLTFNNSITETASNSATGANILYTDPQFLVPGNFNNAPFDTTGLNYRLTIFSEAIDFGLNTNVSGTLDLDGNNRINNATVDLGAYENNDCVSPITFSNAGPYTICGGSPIQLTVDDGVIYEWSTGSTNNSISVNTAGTYSVIFEDINGCRGELVANVTSLANPTPTITYSLGSLSLGSYSSYQWYFNGSFLNGETSSSHTPIEGYGLYQVDVINSGGCEGSVTYCLSPAELSADGPTTFCSGGSVNLTVLNGNNHVWSTGSLSPTISVNSSGLYSVTVLNTAAGCSVNLQQNVVVNPNPTPSINIAGSNLTTTTFTSYQWNFNGNPILGATSQTFDPTSTGNGQYSVTVTNSNGCEATSSVFNLTNLFIEEADNTSIVEVYPNPTSGKVQILLGKEYQNTSVKLFNSLGQAILHKTYTSMDEITFEIEGAPGMYFLEIESAEQALERIRVIKD
jgi:predicted outer membrane repeat protein